MASQSWLIRFGILLLAATFLLPTVVMADQPKMEEALGFLEKAKTSDAPIPLLKKAKAQIAGARHNKGGRRIDAIDTIDEAIAIKENGGDPEAKIILAIAQVRSGMSRGK